METLTPAMDIQVSSNFERYLWYMALVESKQSQTPIGESHDRIASIQVKQWMSQLKSENHFHVSSTHLHIAQRHFSAARVLDSEVCETIRLYSNQFILDPHTAVGIHAATFTAPRKEQKRNMSVPVDVCLATAHPIKFIGGVHLALVGTPAPANFEHDFLGPNKPAVDAQETGIERLSAMKVPHEFVGLTERESRCLEAEASVEAISALITSILLF